MGGSKLIACDEEESGSEWVKGWQQRKKYLHNSQVGQMIRRHDEVPLPLEPTPTSIRPHPPPTNSNTPRPCNDVLHPSKNKQFNVLNEQLNLIMHECVNVCVFEKDTACKYSV